MGAVHESHSKRKSHITGMLKRRVRLQGIENVALKTATFQGFENFKALNFFSRSSSQYKCLRLLGTTSKTQLSEMLLNRKLCMVLT